MNANSTFAKDNERVVLRRGSARDQHLVTLSSLRRNPHEVAEIRLKSRKGDLLETIGPIHGASDYLRIAAYHFSIVRQAMAHHRRLGKKVAEVELVHTHPSDVIHLSQDRSFAKFNRLLLRLSPEDFDTGRNMMRRFPDANIVVTAIVGSRLQDLTNLTIYFER